jgi:hypothetical protein
MLVLEEAERVPDGEATKEPAFILDGRVSKMNA